VIGDVTIAGGHIAYTGPFTPPYRASLNAEWLQKLVELEVCEFQYRVFFKQTNYLNE
jgi:hypothetical protein